MSSPVNPYKVWRSGRHKTEKAWGLLFLVSSSEGAVTGKINEKGEIDTLSALQVVFVDKMVRLLGTLPSILVQHVFLFI